MKSKRQANLLQLSLTGDFLGTVPGELRYRNPGGAACFQLPEQRGRYLLGAALVLHAPPWRHSLW